MCHRLVGFADALSNKGFVWLSPPSLTHHWLPMTVHKRVEGSSCSWNEGSIIAALVGVKPR